MPFRILLFTVLAAFLLSLVSPFPVRAAGPQQWEDGWSELAPGVGYKEFSLPGPVRAYVARMGIADTDPADGINNTLETAIGGGRLGSLETVRGMASRYNDAINFWGDPGQNNWFWGNRSEILVAVNGDYFGSIDTPQNGMVQAGWYAKRFRDLEGGSGLVWNMNRQVFIDDCIKHDPLKQTVKFLDNDNTLLFEEKFTGINTIIDDNRIPKELVLYTPQFGMRTPARADGIEFVVQLQRPLLIIPPSSNSVVGQIIEIRDQVGSTLIPFDAVVISVEADLREELLPPAVQVGDIVQINQEVTSLDRNCNTSSAHPWTKAYASLGAAMHLLESGAAYPPNEDTTRAPRTAIAYDSTYIYLIVVDGRQPGFSIGMTFQELADFILYAIGAQDAVAQDGGGSSTMVVNGSVVNRPSTQCHVLFLPVISNYSGGKVITRPALPLEENFEPPSRLQYGCERRVSNAMMIASVAPKEVSSVLTVEDSVFTTQDGQLRVGPGTNYPAYQIIPAGSFGVIIADYNALNGVRAKGTNWWKVDFGGRTGWIAEGVIDILTPRPSSSAPSQQH